MSIYYVNKTAQANGDHEVHKSGCDYLPKFDNRENLGNHSDCTSAVIEAKKHYDQVDGCYFCSKPCHNS